MYDEVPVYTDCLMCLCSNIGKRIIIFCIKSCRVASVDTYCWCAFVRDKCLDEKQPNLIISRSVILSRKQFCLTHSTMHLCVCVHASFLHVHCAYTVCMHVLQYFFRNFCVCVCVSACVLIIMHWCVCVCVCVCVYSRATGCFISKQAVQRDQRALHMTRPRDPPSPPSVQNPGYALVLIPYYKGSLFRILVLHAMICGH